jgi:tetratricopeptide (TPR) repeat protein
LQGLGKVEEAAGCYRNAYILNDDDERARQHLADLLFEGRVEDVPSLYARDFAFRIVKAHLINITAGEEGFAGDERIPVNNFEEMYKLLTEKFGERTDFTCIALSMLLWYCTIKDTPFDVKSAMDLIAVVGTKADAAESFERLAKNLSHSGYPELALECFARAETLLPREEHFIHLRYNNDLGWCLANIGRHREAEPHFREAVRLNPWLETARRGLGIALLAQGDTGGAERELMAADALAPKSPPRLMSPVCSS